MKMGIATKIIMLFVFVVAVSGGTLSYFLLQYEQGVLLQEFNSRASVLLSSLAVSTELPILVGDARSLERIGTSALKQKDVVFCEISGTEGKKYFAGGSSQAKNSRDYSATVMTERVKQGSQGEDLFLGAAETMYESIGSVRLRFSLDTINAESQHAVLTAFWLVLLGTLVAGLLTIWYLRTALDRPVKELIQGASRVATGNLETKVAIAQQDEMGLLADSFNRMIKVLQNTTVSRNALVREIESRILLEEALRESEQKNRLIIETASDAFIGMDMEGNIVDWNRRAETLFGWKREEVLSKNLSSLLIPLQYRKAHGEGLQKYRLTGEGPVLNKRLELSALHRDGHEFSIELVIWAVLIEKNVIFNAFIRDTTEIKKLQGMIQQSEKMAAVGQLAGGVAHEINNPLGVILGFAQSIVGRLQAHDPLEMPLRSIEREALRCKNLVQDLLTFSRMSKTDQEETDLNETIEGSLSLVQAQSKVKNTTVAKEFTPGLPKIRANKNQIQQVIINLANNAMDAMLDGGTLTIGTGRTTWNGKGAVEIKVKDTGQGMSPEVQKRIFEPFFTTKEVGKGTGLGLSLVYEIVQKHAGQITVSSEIGKGTVFSVLLPVNPS